ncbi:MAG: tRNA glutamyl-Q(34) synthetase GluQRS [Planctomycetota bacterium]|nr:tRNA glutamyl-Q(34) synthetase GluQRS [Planctomycetota bacterium]
MKGRLAPSPTGVLHLGNARSFVLAWLQARSQNGTLILRVEDLDGPRIQEDSWQKCVEDLKWLGLDWDEGPYFQRDRPGFYEAAFEKLKEGGWIYPCTCTRKDVALAASAPHLEEEGPIYPGTCRQKPWSRIQETSEVSWRFAVPPSCTLEVPDLFLESRSWNVDIELGDFIVWKKNKSPAYQLAVVMDDAAQGVTHVLRGDDLFPSAARQMMLYQALQLSVPAFAHVPLVVGNDGRRLAKRHGDTSLRYLRGQGHTPQQVLQWIAQSCLAEDVLPVKNASPQEMLEAMRIGWNLRQVRPETVTWTGSLEAP